MAQVYTMQTSMLMVLVKKKQPLNGWFIIQFSFDFPAFLKFNNKNFHDNKKKILLTSVITLLSNIQVDEKYAFNLKHRRNIIKEYLISKYFYLNIFHHNYLFLISQEISIIFYNQRGSLDDN
ncbi:hypothetical protein TTHERM_000085439 (macronuclear) [Tetrahymena thermophila SB210]|uniref:Uncharacterized protein n=1 Tax=Tetrahymena thermophila (strain SB210) TaxID=312017 RepID=W7XKU4_TETTS|nr:hypothetical protein TTHERM_000085439 [Tetrahymena thermophila SB210]EWS75234.1 hypothetical protein TTHERM_000085439 [Tetrahymena thermophila SB210]|eukprot:XP_012652225.1 hypothetical protein TTHERM_000085439 [Tetrahymena thermophila SB210]